MLAVYCLFALLFSAGGRDLGGIWSALFIWFGAIGSAAAVVCLLQGKPAGRWIGLAVYLVGAVSFLVGAAVLNRPAGDRVFLLALAAANALGVLALYKLPIPSGH